MKLVPVFVDDFLTDLSRGGRMEMDYSSTSASELSDGITVLLQYNIMYLYPVAKYSRHLHFKSFLI